MEAAIVTEAGKPPVYGSFAEPTPVAGEVRISVTASALSNVVKSRAAGTHYSSKEQLPFVVGIDGVGTLDDGRRVYFVLPRAPFGSMSEQTAVASTQIVHLPDDLDDVTAAAIANPGLSAWAALVHRARFVRGETVLVNGATGTAGRLAVQIAKYMGAKRVIATGRNPQSLRELTSLGADITIPIGDASDEFEDALKPHFHDGGIDVVLDYLWGPSAERILIAGAKAGENAVPIRFIQIGSVSAPNITLPSPVLRSSAITLMGSGLGSIPIAKMMESIAELMQATVPGGFSIATKVVPLSQVEEFWSSGDGIPRIVFRTR